MCHVCFEQGYKVLEVTALHARLAHCIYSDMSLYSHQETKYAICSVNHTLDPQGMPVCRWVGLLESWRQNTF